MRRPAAGSTDEVEEVEEELEEEDELEAAVAVSGV